MGDDLSIPIPENLPIYTQSPPGGIIGFLREEGHIGDDELADHIEVEFGPGKQPTIVSMDVFKGVMQ